MPANLKDAILDSVAAAEHRGIHHIFVDNITFLLITRTPISQNDLAGSAKLMYFFDAGIAIGRSTKDSALHYVNQVNVN